MDLTVITNPKNCPLSNAGEVALDCREDCAWYITDSGTEECAIVKLAKGWCL